MSYQDTIVTQRRTKAADITHPVDVQSKLTMFESSSL
jgi:hypothetical protein